MQPHGVSQQCNLQNTNMEPINRERVSFIQGYILARMNH
jgi:hypothetical protein